MTSMYDTVSYITFCKKRIMSGGLCPADLNRLSGTSITRRAQVCFDAENEEEKVEMLYSQASFLAVFHRPLGPGPWRQDPQTPYRCVTSKTGTDCKVSWRMRGSKLDV